MSQNPSTELSSAYDNALEQLYKLSLFRKEKGDIKNAIKLHSLLGAPASQFPCIHVAGTNGKGSVATKIAKALALAGLKVGLFTSPHLLTFRERIAINGEMISKDDVVQGFNRLMQLAKKFRLKPTFFELITNLAADYFLIHNVDVAIFEVGIGGRCDATQIITSILSVITMIGKDHSWLLGETLEEIAAEKAGIIREKVPLVIGPHAEFNAIIERAAEKEAPLIRAKAVKGNFENENRSIAKAALNHLKSRFPLTDAHIKAGIQTMPPCRLQRMTYKGKPVILDVAHNQDALKRLLDAVRVRFPRRSFQVIFGMSRDKDHMGCLSILGENVRHIHLPKVEHYRLSTPDVLLAKLTQMGHTHATEHPSPKAALEAAAKNDDLILICGSVYMMESLMGLLDSKASTISASA